MDWRLLEGLETHGRTYGHSKTICDLVNYSRIQLIHFVFSFSLLSNNLGHFKKNKYKGLCTFQKINHFWHLLAIHFCLKHVL